MRFQQYPQATVNAAIPLYEGQFYLRESRRRIDASGCARLEWFPTPGIVFNITTREPCPHLDRGGLRIELPGSSTTNVAVRSQRSTPHREIDAFVGTMESGNEARLRSAEFEIVNFRPFMRFGPSAVPGDPTAEVTNSETIETVELAHDGWRIKIVAVEDASARDKQLREMGGYGITHVGVLTRVDESTFVPADAKDILEYLRVFLSFARGAACALPIQWGRGVDGTIVWRYFTSPIVDRWTSGHISWFDKHHGELLSELFDPFCRNYRDPSLHEALVIALHWYRHCNVRSSGMEGSIVLGKAALDLLGELVVVKECRSMSAKKYNDLPGAEKLKGLLAALCVDAAAPTRYAALKRFVASCSGGDVCRGLTELRNGFVHATERRRNAMLTGGRQAATCEAWQLLVWYIELALLRVLEYQGSYSNRTTVEWVGQVEPVPWAVSRHNK